MNSPFPFHTSQPETAGATVYHTHPKCRVAQQITIDFQVAGTGAGRHECPFCYVLGQFEENRARRDYPAAEPGR